MPPIFPGRGAGFVFVGFWGWVGLRWVFYCPINFFSGLVIFLIFYNPSVSYPSSSFFWTILTVCLTNLAQTFAQLELVATCN